MNTQYVHNLQSYSSDFFALLAIKCPLIWECVVRKLLLKGCKLFERLVACRRGGPLPVFGGDQPTIWTRIGIHSPSECDLPKVRILFIHFTQRRCWIMVVKEVWWQWLSAASVDFISLIHNGHKQWLILVGGPNGRLLVADCDFTLSTLLPVLPELPVQMRFHITDYHTCKIATNTCSALRFKLWLHSSN